MRALDEEGRKALMSAKSANEAVAILSRSV